MIRFEDLELSKCADGLVPVIVQDWVTLKVLMLGYMNAEALRKTQEEGKVTFWSRGRGCLWTKGETSGNFLLFKDIYIDCDADTLLVMAEPVGPTCHRGTTSCFDTPEDEGFIRKLSRKCVVINVGRGNAVDERALADALAKGRLAGAYLDVCKAEPTAVRRKRTPTTAIDPKRPNVPNLVLMPHASAFSPDYIRLCFKELKDDGCI